MLNNLLSAPQYLPFIVIGAVIIIILIIYFIAKRNPPLPNYFVKDALMTNVELQYFRIINSYLGDRYIVLPQVNLASVIDKEDQGFRTELFRNVDFGVFDYNYRPLLLIEINDNTHFRKDRVERDKKVNAICHRAKLPIVTFWTKDGIDPDKIVRTINRYL